MSYCRWSDDNFGCDLYAYPARDGYYVHVAALRIVSALPDAPLILSTPDWAARYEDYMEAVGDAQREPIGLAHDGATFVEDTAADLLARVLALRELGYRIPEWAIEDIRIEGSMAAVDE